MLRGHGCVCLRRVESRPSANPATHRQLLAIRDLRCIIQAGVFHPPDEKCPGTAARYCARSLVNPLALCPKHSKYVPSNAELFSALAHRVPRGCHSRHYICSIYYIFISGSHRDASTRDMIVYHIYNQHRGEEGSLGMPRYQCRYYIEDIGKWSVDSIVPHCADLGFIPGFLGIDPGSS